MIIYDIYIYMIYIIYDMISIASKCGCKNPAISSQENTMLQLGELKAATRPGKLPSGNLT